MPIWKTQSVLQTPEINLNAWRVFEVSSPLWPKITRHFVGYNSAGRLCSVHAKQEGKEEEFENENRY